MPRIISLTTDFGLKDPYVAEMKAAILGICPDAIIVDVTHGVDKFNVRAGAFMLASAAPYFPNRIRSCGSRGSMRGNSEATNNH